MKILLINNHTDYLHNVVNALDGHKLEIQIYRPGLDFHFEDKDLIVLSGGGGEGYEIKDKRNGKYWYEDEMSFVLACDKPLVGICMGFEVISAAYGAQVKHAGRLIKGFHNHTLRPAGKSRFSHDKLRQYEHHRYAVPDISSKHFEVLAHSDSGIEMIKHKQKKIIATQFHPEVTGGSLELSQVIASLV